MENKQDTHKHTGPCDCGEKQKNTDEKVFELTPSGSAAAGKSAYSFKKTFPLGFMLGALATILVSFALVSLYLAPIIKNWSVKNPLTIEQARAKAENFINDNLMKAGSKITIKGIEDKNGLYKVAVSTGGAEDIDTYITKDGKIFFTQALNIEQIENDKKNTPEDIPAAAVPKTDKPNVELFVMSHCPFGTQIEKGILPAVNALGSKIDFDVKFTDYAMHGEKELQEELAQYCIKTNEPAKFNNYLKCFVESAGGDSAGCLAKSGINKSKLATCVAATDKQFKVTENFNDPAKTAWKGNFPPFEIYKESNLKYGVTGSPTLVINGTKAESGRDSASLLKTICSAFNTPPKECETALSADTPAAGFGTGASASSSSASCGN